MIDTPKRCIIVIIYKKGDVDIMKNKNDIQEFSYNVLSRTYTIKVYGQKKDFEKNLNAPCYALTSLFVEDSKNPLPISNLSIKKKWLSEKFRY